MPRESRKLPINVSLVVSSDLEGLERLACGCGALQQVLVEHLLPASGVQLGGRRQDPVEIEQDRVESVRDLSPQLTHRHASGSS
jgi:hypothetical protein